MGKFADRIRNSAKDAVQKGKQIANTTKDSVVGAAQSAGDAAGAKIDQVGNSLSEEEINKRVESLKTEAGLLYEYNLSDNGCFRAKVNQKYKAYQKDDEPANLAEKIVNIRGVDDINKIYPFAAKIVYNRDSAYVMDALRGCLASKAAAPQNPSAVPSQDTDQKIRNDLGGPFDRRLDRDLIGSDGLETRIPFSIQYEEIDGIKQQLSAIDGLLASDKTIEEGNFDEGSLKKIQDQRAAMRKDPMYLGVPAMINVYALTKLYGSDGGKRLINQRNERRWYEVDQTLGDENLANFASNPTTSSLISWGTGDPYGRTPYHFTDFVFSKYWNKIENNRLITLRRFGAPIVDNLKFPGMDGITKLGTPGDADGNNGTEDKGSTSMINFPPMASAITYFGEETGNKLSELLKFTTGMKWGDVKSGVWEVSADQTPDNEAGPGGMGGVFGKMANLSKMLAVAGGDFNPQLIMNQGNLPPDPYKNGPYENRILGPINRIDEVKRRDAGLTFEWGGLDLQFEYVARPVGGVNPKAVLLDILSNFLIMGSASAVFFGGQHRFMSNPAQYPFLGGEKGIEAWYSGKPLDWAENTIKSFVGQVTNKEGGIADGAGSFFDQLLGKGGPGGIKGIFGAVKGLFSGDGIGTNLIKGKLAEKSGGQVPYLSGMKALLTGEPVGEWHVTIGNPLNPIAMIGNLICTGVEVEFNDELGPDDFPTEIKITVKLEHGMARDRDAIQSVFNRGMGRIYDLPSGFEGSADGNTAVDKYTQNVDKTGTALAFKGWLAGPSKLGGKSGPSVQKTLANGGETSVWDRAAFVAVSPNVSLIDSEGQLARSAYRGVDWLALKSLK